MTIRTSGTANRELEGKIALVTGSSRGIGWTIAQSLAGAGARVVINGRDTAQLESACRAASGDGQELSFRAFDVTIPGEVAAGVQSIESELGRIDILVNNAGINRRGALVEYKLSDWDDIQSVNVRSIFVVSQAVARNMIPRGSGKIINVCSISSEIVRPNIGAYAASKGAVKMLTKAMCAEWAKFGIQANGIGPGFFRTEMNMPLYNDPEFDAWVKKRTPAGRWGELHELGGVSVFLASPRSDFVNGQIIYVDGGLTSVA